jgi:predicted nucleic acid-binding Zn ribbon protein
VLEHIDAGTPGQSMVPVYVYRRQDGSPFELQQRMSDESLSTCPTTGQSVERILQPFSPHHKGTGFYSTDHRRPRSTPSPKTEGGE